jgi:NADP-dependent 3-hydroxy acid dehydrogenase YdfG
VDYFGKVDICVIGSGANWNTEDLKNLKPENALQDVNQEISPIYNLFPMILKDMEKRKWGRIIGIASNMDIPSPSYSYNAAKSGRIEALKLAVNEAWIMGVTVNIIGPGPVDEIPNLEEAYANCSHNKEWLDRNKVSPQDIAEGVALQDAYCHTYFSGGIYADK